MVATALRIKPGRCGEGEGLVLEVMSLVDAPQESGPSALSLPMMRGELAQGWRGPGGLISSRSFIYREQQVFAGMSQQLGARPNPFVRLFSGHLKWLELKPQV